MSRLANRYARALFDAAREKHAVDAVAHDLAAIERAFTDPAMRAVLLDPQTQRAEREAALGGIVQRGHELSRNLIGVLLRRRRESVLPELRAPFAAMVREMRGEVEGVVETARPLAEDQLMALQKSTSALIGKQVTLTARVDPGLIGGVRLRVGNTLYDGSAATTLEELERRLMVAPIS